MTEIGKTLVLIFFSSIACYVTANTAHVGEDGINSALKLDMHSVRGQLASLQSRMSHQQQTISKLEKKSKTQDEEQKKLEHTIQGQEETIRKQSQKIHNLKQIVTSNPSQQKSNVSFDPIGFTAYKEYYQHCNHTEPLEFTGVISNVGNIYDDRNSSFTCPFIGVYMFSVSVKMERNYNSNRYLSINRNNESIATIWADGDDVSDLSTPAGVVVFECDVGEVVWISCGGSDYVYGSSDKESLFVGYMLYRYE